VINYGAKELYEAKKIINAREQVGELSRTELMELHEEIERQKRLNRHMSEEIDRLLSEINDLRGKLGGEEKA